MLARALQHCSDSSAAAPRANPSQNTLNARKGITTAEFHDETWEPKVCQNTLNARKGITTQSGSNRGHSASSCQNTLNARKGITTRTPPRESRRTGSERQNTLNARKGITTHYGLNIRPPLSQSEYT